MKCNFVSKKILEFPLLCNHLKIYNTLMYFVNFDSLCSFRQHVNEFLRPFYQKLLLWISLIFSAIPFFTVESSYYHELNFRSLKIELHVVLRRLRNDRIFIRVYMYIFHVHKSLRGKASLNFVLLG